MNIFLQKKEALGVSYTDISKATGLDRSFAHGIINGTRPIPLEQFIKLALYFGLSGEEAIRARQEMETGRFKKSLDADCADIARAFAR